MLNVKEKAIPGTMKVVQFLTDSNCFTLGCLKTNASIFKNPSEQLYYLTFMLAQLFQEGFTLFH